MSSLPQENELFSQALFDPGASSDTIQQVESALGVSLLTDYVDFVRRFNGGEGFLGDHYLQLWKIEELKSFNDDYQTAPFAPGILLFGSSGGGEAYAFDTRHHPWTIVQVTFIVLDLKDARPMGKTFSEFLQRLASDSPGQDSAFG